jgi:hypothetical protein
VGNNPLVERSTLILSPVRFTQDAETQRDRLKAYSYGDTLLCRSFDRFVLAFLRVPASLRENGFEDAVLFQVSHS